MGSVFGGQSCGRRLLGEVLQALFIVWGLAVLSIAWCIGVTRFRDNRHNIDDILVSCGLLARVALGLPADRLVLYASEQWKQLSC